VKATRWKVAAVPVAVASLLALAACGGDDDDSASTGAGGSSSGAALTKVKLQLQWTAQAQFAGYYAAKAEGFFKDEGLDVDLIEAGTDTVPQNQLANGAADYAIAWVPKALASRESGAKITDIGQMFERSATLQVSWKDSNITSVADLKGKKVGNWGFGNEFELTAGLTKAGIDPKTGVTMVQQQFDESALLAHQIDAAQAMVYNEYAQLLEATDPKTGKLYTPDDFNTISWNDVGTAMLQDAIWADTDKLKSDATYKANSVKLLKASMKGWIFCRDNPDKCVQDVLAAGPTLGESHQTWQLAHVNGLIWPSTDGIGVMDKALWDQTVSVATSQDIIKKTPDSDAYRTDLAEEAVKELKAEGVDTTGAGYTVPDVTLKAGGK
jgi:NitT/TauT family transport system substrate-binding protein